MKKLLLSSIAASLLAACASTPEPTKAPVENRTQAPAATPAPAEVKPVDLTPAPQAPVQSSGLAPHLDPANKLSSERSVYFDFDQYVVKDEYRATVESHAKYLTEQRNLKIKIEGNADERGSREYNLALGQKRADAVKRSMQTVGVQENQIETISYGEEKPKATGETEEAWAQNRRADIVYEGENK